MRFLHAADIHLDSPLRGLSAYPDAPAERLRGATREAFVNLVDRAIDERVDFVVIAGDVYDGDWRDFNTGLFFVRQMGRLRQAGIPVYLLHGNHDAESEMTRRLEMPDNVHVFTASKPITFRIDALRVALHGRSFKVAATTENLAAAYPAPVPGWLNIGVLHTALEGNAAHASYAPCSLAELQARGYQYWALGHVHEQRVWREGTQAIAYPGNLQGRHIREAGAKGALMVTANEAGEIMAIEPLALDVLRWHMLDVDVSAAEDFGAAVRCVGRAMERLLAEQPGSQALALRVQLQGACAAHGALIANERQLREEVLGQAVGLDAEQLWIERVRVQTRPLASAASPDAADGMADGAAEGADALASLAAQAARDPEFLAALQADLQPLLDSIKHEALDASPELQALRAGDLSLLMGEALPGLLARVDRIERMEAGR